jgi:hypothetical protein
MPLNKKPASKAGFVDVFGYSWTLLDVHMVPAEGVEPPT